MPITLNGTTGEVFPSWTTAGRPTSPVAGQTGYNTTLGLLETYNGTAWVNTGNKNSITQTVLTTGTTYTVPAGVTWLRVRMVGGGGNGGGGGSGTGGGGGAGGYLEGLITSPLSSYSYTVGAAGSATTFGTSLFTANGGSAGVAGTTSAAGGAGGSATGGYLNLTGASGGYGWASAPYYSGGYGAASAFGGGGSGGGTNNGGGAPAVSAGSGGGGGVGGGGSGAGAAGIIIIEEHYNW